jgi:hypothetical protein
MLKTMNLDRLNDLETIDPRPLPPWRAESFTEIEIGSDRDTARDRAETVGSISDIVVYSDASGRESHLGVAEPQQVQVGPMDHWSIHVAELIGIFCAISVVFKIAHQRSRTVDRRQIATILCDSRSSLQVIQSARNKSVFHAAAEVLTVGITPPSMDARAL